MRVLRPDETLAALNKPELVRTDRFEFEPDDCLVVCAGFEDRATGIIEKTARTSKFNVLVIEYLPFFPENRMEELVKLCQRNNFPFSVLKYDRQNPASFGQILLAAIAEFHGTIFFDVSAMSRLLIVQCLCALAEREQCFRRCAVVYTEAEEYPPSRYDVEQALLKAKENPIQNVLLLSSGVFDVCVVPELSSPTFGSTQTRLVAFPTFSSDQLTALLNELGPSRVTLIEGDPPDQHNKWRTNAIRNVNSLQGIRHESILTSTIDYRETLNTLLKLYASYSERERIMISPTGSKMQTIAVGLFRSILDDVQIVYPTPKDFCSPRKYTCGIGGSYMLRLDCFAELC